MSATPRIDRLWPESEPSLSDDNIATAIADARGDGPWLSANFVSSLDGAGTHDGKSAGLGGAADKRVFDLLRRPCDAVLVGAGTVRDEGYGPMVLDAASASWREAAGFAPQPVFAIVSGRLDLNPESPVFRQAPVRAIVITLESAPADKRAAMSRFADVLVCGDDALDVPSMVGELARRGLRRVHNEGGPSLFGTLLAADAVDELSLTVSPQLEGGDARRIVSGDLPEARHLGLASILKSDDTLLLRYARRGLQNGH